jgi:hypothetical protein
MLSTWSTGTLVGSQRLVARALRRKQAALAPLEPQQDVGIHAVCRPGAGDGAAAQAQRVGVASLPLIKLRQSIERLNFKARITGLNGEQAGVFQVVVCDLQTADIARQRADRQAHASARQGSTHAGHVARQRNEQHRPFAGAGQACFIDPRDEYQRRVRAGQHPCLGIEAQSLLRMMAGCGKVPKLDRVTCARTAAGLVVGFAQVGLGFVVAARLQQRSPEFAGGDPALVATCGKRAKVVDGELQVAPIA